MTKRVFSALFLSLVTLRCATIVHGRSQLIHVTSSPSGAAVSLTCGETTHDAGVTPVDVRVMRSASSCAIGLSASGFVPRTIPLTRARSGAILLNVLPGLAVGAAAGVTASNQNIFLSDNRHESNSNGKSLAGLLGGTGLGILIDQWTGALYKQVPGTVDVTLDPVR
jgi:hypothetical protein